MRLTESAMINDHILPKERLDRFSETNALNEVKYLIDYFKLNSYENVLDVGCGTGRHTLAFAQNNLNVTGIDKSDLMIHLAKKYFEQKLSQSHKIKYQLLTQDIRNPIIGPTYDIVICLYGVLHSCDDTQSIIEILSSIFCSCKPGAKIVIAYYNSTQLDFKVIRNFDSKPTTDDLNPFICSTKNYNNINGTLGYNSKINLIYYRKQLLDANNNIQEDSINSFRVIYRHEMISWIEQIGFVNIQEFNGREGDWDFKKESPFAPVNILVAQRPEDIHNSMPRIIQNINRAPAIRIDIIPAKLIRSYHAHIVSRLFCTSFGKNPKTGKMQILGPKRMYERLIRCSILCIVSIDSIPIGYMFGTEYPDMYSAIAWIDSICVQKEFRRKGYATLMLDCFVHSISAIRWLGATSPNPVTPLILEKLRFGNTYLPGRIAPPHIVNELKIIQQKCEDLRKCDIDSINMLVKTNFSVELDDDDKYWKGKNNDDRPSWWSTLANLPEDYESLLIIDRGENFSGMDASLIELDLFPK